MKKCQFDSQKIIALLNQSRSLCDIINTTVNAHEFFGNLNLLIDNLLELSQYEHKDIFKDGLPSQDLESISEDMEDIVNAFIERSYENQLEILSGLNIDDKNEKMNRFFRELLDSCNNIDELIVNSESRRHHNLNLFPAGSRQYLDKLKDDYFQNVQKHEIKLRSNRGTGIMNINYKFDNFNFEEGTPFYISTSFIAFCFFWWFLIIPFPIGIYLIMCRHEYDKKLLERYRYLENRKKDFDNISEMYESAQKAIDQSQKSMEECQKECDRMRKESWQECHNKNLAFEKEISRLREKKKKLKEELEILKAEITVENVILPYVDESISSEEYRSKYSLLVMKEKELIKQEEAVIIVDKKAKKAVINNDIKQLLRCFNSETDTHIRSITVKNISTIKNRITKTYETLNKLFETDGIKLNHSLVEIKLEEADLMYRFEYQKEQERLQQKAIRDQMVEEEKVRREIEKEKARIEKEETHFHREIDKLMLYLKSASDIEKQLYVDKIRELEAKLKEVEEDKKNVLDREQNTRAGYVYIISNIGSFGEGIYKIGMTRRLEPMERVNELGSASVPFEFDVHAMIFSEDAPALETALHNAFQNRRVNMVNRRKEFFRVSLQEIEEVVKENFNATVQFTMTAEAFQYRESQRILEKQLATI